MTAITCAGCGCLVDRGMIVEACPDHPECCCAHLPAAGGNAGDTRGDRAR